MYINAVASGVTLQLYLERDFCNIIFKIQRKMHVLLGSASPPPLLLPVKNSVCLVGGGDVCLCCHSCAFLFLYKVCNVPFKNVGCQ